MVTLTGILYLEFITGLVGEYHTSVVLIIFVMDITYQSQWEYTWFNDAFEICNLLQTYISYDCFRLFSFKCNTGTVLGVLFHNILSSMYPSGDVVPSICVCRLNRI